MTNEELKAKIEDLEARLKRAQNLYNRTGIGYGFIIDMRIELIRLQGELMK